MRKNILTTAMILGSIGAQAGSFNFTTKKFPLELTGGEQIEINLQIEQPQQEYTENILNVSEGLGKQTLDHENMIELLNRIRIVEQEVEEDLPVI
ncbi:MAG: hypothetical protein EA393_02710 [Bacteroidetes bacterium]|nr:MAG: hypothetical protein EA393_02710 [Bacteroidota bacterium]